MDVGAARSNRVLIVDIATHRRVCFMLCTTIVWNEPRDFEVLPIADIRHFASRGQFQKCGRGPVKYRNADAILGVILNERGDSCIKGVHHCLKSRCSLCFCRRALNRLLVTLAPVHASREVEDKDYVHRNLGQLSYLLRGSHR